MFRGIFVEGRLSAGPGADIWALQEALEPGGFAQAPPSTTVD